MSGQASDLVDLNVAMSTKSEGSPQPVGGRQLTRSALGVTLGVLAWGAARPAAPPHCMTAPTAEDTPVSL